MFAKAKAKATEAKAAAEAKAAVRGCCPCVVFHSTVCALALHEAEFGEPSEALVAQWLVRRAVPPLGRNVCRS